MMHWDLKAGLLFVAIAIVSAGCGEMPAAATSSPRAQPARATPVVDDRPKLPQVTRDEYANLAAAWADVETLSRDPTGGQKLLRIERWLALQGDKIAPELIAAINNPAVGLATRLTACRALARLGQVGAPTLIAATDGEPKQLRLKAIESLGRIEPTSNEIVEKLVSLVSADDFESRKAALGGLREVGPPAKKAAGTLQSLLDDPQEDETIRSLAKAALQAVDPRTGLKPVQ
jgi:hypothetical protein